MPLTKEHCLKRVVECKTQCVIEDFLVRYEKYTLFDLYHFHVTRLIDYLLIELVGLN